jgi:hypothetical protein
MMLSRHPDLNPALIAAAELLTDSAITDTILRDAAISRGLPLLVARRAPEAPSPVTAAGRAVTSAEAFVAQARRAFDGARRDLRP